MKLSVAIATHNEEKNILRTLESVYDWAFEIVIVDGESKDKTVDAVKNFDKNRKIKIYHERHEAMFHKNKQKAIEHCSGDWILQLDADEVVSPELKNEIIHTVKSQLSNVNGQMSGHFVAYWLPRLNYFLGQPLKKGGQYPDYTIRLYKNGVARFPCKDVHEQVEIRRIDIPSQGEGSLTEKIGYLKNPLHHYPYPTFAEYLRKWKLYCALEAQNLKNAGVRPSLYLASCYLFLYPIKWFFLTYFRHLGILDGLPGLVFSLFSSLRFPLIYAILRVN